MLRRSLPRRSPTSGSPGNANLPIAAVLQSSPGAAPAGFGGAVFDYAVLPAMPEPLAQETKHKPPIEICIYLVIRPQGATCPQN
jgi:hypothetical protein